MCYIRGAYAGGTPVVEKFSSGEEFLSRFTPGDYDTIFIDWYVGGLSGINTTRKVRSQDKLAALVFVTTGRKHAIKSYEVQTCGCLVEPLNYENFRQTMKLARLNKIRDARLIHLEQNHLLLREILWCSQSSHYVMIHTDKRGVLKFRIPFGELTEILSSYLQPLTCYKYCIVNMDRVERINGLDFMLDNGKRIPFSRRDGKRVMALFGDYLFQREREEEMF